MTTERETTYKVHQANGYGLQSNTGSDGTTWYHGYVRTPLGYVTVYAEEKHASFSIIHDGYEVTRVYKKTLTHRGLVTLARKFIEEMA